MEEGTTSSFDRSIHEDLSLRVQKRSTTGMLGVSQLFQHPPYTSAVWTSLPETHPWPSVYPSLSCLDDAKQPTGVQSQTFEMRTLDMSMN